MLREPAGDGMSYDGVARPDVGTRLLWYSAKKPPALRKKGIGYHPANAYGILRKFCRAESKARIVGSAATNNKRRNGAFFMFQGEPGI
jgi:hypothetical protein